MTVEKGNWSKLTFVRGQRQDRLRNSSHPNHRHLPKVSLSPPSRRLHRDGWWSRSAELGRDPRGDEQLVGKSWLDGAEVQASSVDPDPPAHAPHCSNLLESTNDSRTSSGFLMAIIAAGRPPADCGTDVPCEVGFAAAQRLPYLRRPCHTRHAHASAMHGACFEWGQDPIQS